MIKKILISVACLMSFTLSFSQSNKDYLLLKSTSNDIFNLEKYKDVKLKNEPIEFNNQEFFFTRNNFENYIEPIIGTNSEKLKKMIKCLDFDFLASQKREKNGIYEIEKINKLLTEYISPLNNNDKVKFQNVFFISLPVYSKDEKLAFIFYNYYCGIDCGQSGVKIYKFKKGTWVFENNMIISVS